MKFLLTTCNSSKRIIPAQQYLFSKYVTYPFEYEYIDLEGDSIETWGHNILKRIGHINDEFVLFGLDDYLPIDVFDCHYFNQLLSLDFERLEISWDSSTKGIDRQWYKEYSINQPYRVSCQFSVWKTVVLKDVLSKCTTPWNFELHSKIQGPVLANSRPVFRWIEESVFSGRLPGRTNVMGLKHNDIAELVQLGYIDESTITWTWYDFPGPIEALRSRHNEAHNWNLKYGMFYE